MDETKLCPLFSIDEKSYRTECLEEECAWYDEVERRCVIKTLAITIAQRMR